MIIKSMSPSNEAKGDDVTRFIDRIVERIVPRATVFACSGVYICNPLGHPLGYWFRFCCPQTGCEWTQIATFC
jgi:hypothetical protein